MRAISYDGRWEVLLTEEQYRAGREAVLQPDTSHFKVFNALKEAGVPVREGDKYPASQAATAFQYQRIMGELA